MLRAAAAAVLACVLLAGPIPAAGQPPASLREQAYDAIYNLDYDRGDELFKQAIAADATDAAAYRGLATSAWLRILFLRGTVTVDEYLGKMSSSDLKMPAPPAAYAAEFQSSIKKAVDLGEAAASRASRSASAHYELGAGLGLVASYTGTVEGRVFAAMRAARRAFSEHERVLELDPRRHDAGLVVGTYRYIVANLPAPLRWMAYMVGFGGDRALAIKRLQEAAAYPSDVQPAARFALVLIYNREARYDEAISVVRGLEQSYPRNRLLWLEEGGTALRAMRPREALDALDAGLARMERDTRMRMPGESAQLHYKRGLARLRLGDRAGAEQDLREALNDQTGAAWVRGRTHIELGKLADLAGDREKAKVEYQTAVTLCDRSRDSIGADEARRWLGTPYRQ